jgi:hypothetical protein
MWGAFSDKKLDLWFLVQHILLILFLRLPQPGGFHAGTGQPSYTHPGRWVCLLNLHIIV